MPNGGGSAVSNSGRCAVQSALMPGNGDRVGYWLTPPEIMDRMRAEFDFDFDPCPYPRPAGFDGLSVDWGRRNWVNPPFEGPQVGFTKWVKKAIEENRKGKTVVLILPMFAWVARLIEAGAEVRSLGSHEWLHPNGKRRRAPKPSLLFILRPSSRLGTLTQPRAIRAMTDNSAPGTSFFPQPQPDQNPNLTKTPVGQDAGKPVRSRPIKDGPAMNTSVQPEGETQP